jgi:hypothetical protein
MQTMCFSIISTLDQENSFPTKNQPFKKNKNILESSNSKDRADSLLL